MCNPNIWFIGINTTFHFYFCTCKNENITLLLPEKLWDTCDAKRLKIKESIDFPAPLIPYSWLMIPLADTSYQSGFPYGLRGVIMGMFLLGLLCYNAWEDDAAGATICWLRRWRWGC